MSWDNVEERIFRAYFRRHGKYAPMPNHNAEVWEEDGKWYGRLANVNGILAVYRIRDDGSLKWLKRKFWEF